MQRLLWVAHSVLAVLAAQASNDALLSCLAQIPGSSDHLAGPASSTYNHSRLGFNYIFDNRPVAIFNVSSTRDVQMAVACATSHNTSVAPRSGGHSYEGYSQGGRDGALVLDLRRLKKFVVDNETGVATIGSGWTLGPLYDALWKHDKLFIAAGTCPSVGVGGHFLGGGIGVAARKYGLATDNIISMTMVDARGMIRKIDANENHELFWALRGAGGGSFGVVTEFQIQTYTAPERLTRMSFDYPINDTFAIRNYMQWLNSSSLDLMATMSMGTYGLSFGGTYLGPKEEALKAIAPLLDACGKPIKEEVVESDWYELATHNAWLNGGDLANPVTGDGRYARGGSLIYRKPLTIEEVDIMVRYLTHAPKQASASYVLIDPWGGKIDHPTRPRSFDNHRGVLFSIEFVEEWGDAESEPGLPLCMECLQWSKDFEGEMRKAYHGPLEAYQNYIERDMSLDAYYGSSLARLSRVKRSVDPKNRFSFPQSIPLYLS